MSKKRLSEKRSFELIVKGVAVALSLLLLLGIVIGITWPLPLIIVGDVYGWLRALIHNTDLWRFLVIVLSVPVALMLFIVFVFPVIAYFLKRIYAYLSIMFICLIRNYKMKLLRIPFSSIKRLSAKGDVSVATEEGILYLHFLDIVYPRKRALTIPNESEYVITPIVKGKLSREGSAGGGPRMNGDRTIVFRVTGHTLQENSDRIRKLPAVQETTGEKHILVIQSMPVEATVNVNGTNLPLSSGQKIGSLTIYSFKQLKKGLKKQLHCSLFDHDRREKI